MIRTAENFYYAQELYILIFLLIQERLWEGYFCELEMAFLVYCEVEMPHYFHCELLTMNYQMLNHLPIVILSQLSLDGTG